MSISHHFRRLPLGMNSRNHLIRLSNEETNLVRVKDKSGFKKSLQEFGIAVPRTIRLIEAFPGRGIMNDLPGEFVIKPNRGFGGHGVMLLMRQDNEYADPSGEVYSEQFIRRHIRKILDGDFSGNSGRDSAICEERIFPSSSLRFKDALGLPDIRIFCFEFEPVMAMLRYPTIRSKGKSNLTAGGIGIGLDVSKGTPTFIHVKGMPAEPTPEEIGMPPAFAMPKWEEMKSMASRCSEIADLGLTGVDIILDSNDEVRVLEVNGRPGLEIQNVNEASLLDRFNAMLRARNARSYLGGRRGSPAPADERRSENRVE